MKTVIIILIFLNNCYANLQLPHAEQFLHAKETHGKAELKATVKNEYVQIGYALKALKEATEALGKSKDDYGKYKTELSKQEAHLAELEQKYKNKTGFIELADVEEMKDLLNDLKEDDAYYKANIALATATLATKTTAVLAQGAKAARSSGTYGFNAGLELDIDAIEKQLKEYEERSIASNLDANNINLTANNKATIQGSNLNANEHINVNAKTTDIIASQDISNQDASSEHKNINLSFDTAGGPGISVSADSSTTSANQLNYTNSQLQANNITINTQETTTIQGANLNAEDTLTLNTKNLEVASVQNTTKSKSHGEGMSAGFGASGLTSLGANSSNGSSNSKETLLTSLTGNKVDITVTENTTLKGATIAAVDTDGNDNGQLNLSTNTLNVSSLNNTNTSKSTSVGGNLGFAENVQKDDQDNVILDKDGNPVTQTGISSVGIDYSNDQTNSKTKTLATLGNGNIQIADQTNSDTTMLNTDVANNEIDIYNISSHKGLKGELDTRLLTSDGQKQIAEDLLKTTMITDTIKQIATNETVGVTDFFSNIAKENKTYDAIKAKIAQSPELAAMLQDNTLSSEQKETMMNAITDEVLLKLGYTTVDNKLINAQTAGRDDAQVKGYHSEETGDSYINERYVTTNEGLIATSGSEAQRAIDSQNNENWTEAQRSDRAEFVQHVGENIVDYTNFSLNINGYDNGISTYQNSIEQPKIITQTPSVFNNSIANNNQIFNTIDKTKGDNLCVNSMDCYGNKTEIAFNKTQSVMTDKSVGNYNLINQINPNNGNTEYYALYNKQTGNTVNLKPEELNNLQQMAETNPEAFKNLMAVYEMQSNTTHTVNNAITGLHDDGYVGGNLDSWGQYISSGEMLLDIMPGGVAAKVETNLVKNSGNIIKGTTVEEWGIGSLREPAQVMKKNEDVLIDITHGLQTKQPNSEPFKDIILGKHGDAETTYLYTVDERGINIVLEKTPFPTPRGNVVHSNISSKASIGGEVWFGPNNTVTINAGSGRFGDRAGITSEQWEATAKLWESLGYKVNKIPFGER